MNSPSARLVVLLAVLLAVTPAVSAAVTPPASPSHANAGGDVDIPLSLQQGNNSSDETDAARVTNVTFGGNALLPNTSVQANDNNTYLWVNGQFTTNVTFTVPSENATGNYEACLLFNRTSNGTQSSPVCKEAPSSQGQYTVTFEFENFRFGAPGTYQVQAFLAQSGIDGRTSGDPTNQTLVVLEKADDFDSDGLTNQEEVKRGTFVNGSDSDKDGLLDGQEVQSHGTSPTNPDTDGDGLPDGQEVQNAYNATKTDTDGDGLSDSEEVKEYNTDPTAANTDNDGLPDNVEVEYIENGTYPNLDPTAPDSDGDGLIDGEEIQEYGSNPTLRDSDGDLLSDETEAELGTDPASAFSPFGWALLAILALAAVVVYLMRQGTIPAPDVPVITRRQSRPSGGAMIDGRPETDGADSEPLTDSEHVRDLIESNGGQIRQSRIVEETGWSKAKVSRVLSRMDENNEISKIRIGRENLICLPGHEPPSMRQ